MGTDIGRRSRGRRPRASAVAVGFLLTLAFALGQTTTVFAAGGLSGGDVSLDYVAAGPGTYNHDTGVGGAYNDRTISKSSGVVESLEGGDFACNDLVVFFTRIAIDPGAAGSGTVQLDLQWDGQTTGQPGIGFVNLVSASANPNPPDSGNTANGNETVTVVSETDSPNVNATISVSNLDPGEHFILRTVVRLGCQVGAHPTGNILTAINDASVIGDGKVNIGQQTVPMKKVEDIASPGIQVQKSCPASAPVSSTITYSITVSNTGNEDLSNLVVNDPLLGGNLGKFPSSLASGGSDQETFDYTIKPGDPDPLTNGVTATATGAVSGATVTGTDSCVTDVEHQPGIKVEKTCTPSGEVGSTITYSITVKNTGNEDLKNLVVNDPLLGGDLGKFPSSLAVKESDTETFHYTIKADDPTPLTNTVSATATGVDSGKSVSDEASCGTTIVHPTIDVTKDGPDLAHVGDTITYTFTVTNNGDNDLHNVVLSDPICDDAIAITDQGDGDQVLAVGEVWKAECHHTVTTADPDPLPNTVTATGTDSLGATVSDTADHVVDLIHPAIQIVKTADPKQGLPGTTITYSYAVTNIGDTTLYDVSVDDDVIGHIGDIAKLDPGKTVTLTATFTLGLKPVVNVGTAAGHDVLGKKVEDSDNARVIVILPKIQHNNPPHPTAFTGFNDGRLAGLGLVLLLTGVGAALLGRRRRGNQEV